MQPFIMRLLKVPAPDYDGSLSFPVRARAWRLRAFFFCGAKSALRADFAPQKNFLVGGEAAKAYA